MSQWEWNRRGLVVYARRATQPAQGTCSTISSVTAVSFIKSPRIGTNASTAKAIRRKLEPTIFPPFLLLILILLIPRGIDRILAQQPCTCSSLQQRWIRSPAVIIHRSHDLARVRPSARACSMRTSRSLRAGPLCLCVKYARGFRVNGNLERYSLKVGTVWIAGAFDRLQI